MRKSAKDLDGKNIVSKYRSFIGKFAKGDNGDDDNQWRGATDFTRISNQQIEDMIDEKRSQVGNKRSARKRSARKKSNSKRRLLTFDESQDFQEPRSFLQTRDQSNERTNYNSLIEKQLSSIKQ